ncbi:MAG: NRDE family protein [Pseudomonadales bacterium]
MILIAHRVHPDLPLVVAANRDEFYARPTASAHFWHGPEGMLAGKDLEAGGTWLGVDERGRFAAVTNVGEPPSSGTKLSRGALVQDFLRGQSSAQPYAAQIEGERYRGFNLLLWDGESLIYTSNRSDTVKLAAGVYGLANASLNEDRHKVGRGKAALAAAVAQEGANAELNPALLALLADREAPATAEGRKIPGRSAAELISMGACFIVGSDYGTRASTAVAVGHAEVHFSEQIYIEGGLAKGRSQHRMLRRRD